MITIIFESHSTTFDNENHLASGWNDVELSSLGIEQAKDLGKRRNDEHFDAIFCSDLKRSYETAEIAFGDKFPIIKDKRLRECNYGNLTQHPSSEVDPEKLKRIDTAFPNGESYNQTSERMRDFLHDLVEKYSDNQKIMIIGHRATQYGLEHWIEGRSLTGIISELWKWQPGWEYKVTSFFSK